MQNWKTTAAGVLSAFSVAVGPISGFLAALQAMKPHPDYTLAIIGAALTAAAAIARLWIGLIQNDAPPTLPPSQGAPGVTTGSSFTKLGALLLVAAVALTLTGCPNATLQKAAQASQNAAIIVQGLENAEIAAHAQGLIPQDDHIFIQREVATLAALGKTTDSCIAGAGSTAGAVVCINTAVAQVDKINADGGLYLKSTTAKQDFSIAMSGVKTVLLSIETTINGPPPTAAQ